MNRTPKNMKLTLSYQLLVFIRKKGEASIYEMVTELGGDKYRSNRALGVLKEHELVYCVLNGIYQVTDKGAAPRG